MTSPLLLQRAALFAAVVGLLAPTLSAQLPAGTTAQPFAPKSGTGGAMRFTAIPAAESGLRVENPYDDPAMWGARYTEFQGGAIGSGLAVGDVDGDGLADIFVANKCRPSQLFRQVAPFKFADITAAAGVAGPAAADGTGWKTGATFADVDGDGDLDLYVCRFNAPNLLYLNDGQGRFTERAAAAGLDLVSGSVIGAFEDYDRDGHLDVFIVTNVADADRNPDGERDRLYRNRGNGTFEEVSARAGIGAEPGRGHAGTWFDSNEDGWPDLHVSNDFSTPDRLYRNNGDGTFTDVLATAFAHTPWFSMGADSADINNDGLADLFVAEMAGTTHFKSKVAMGDMGGLVDYMDTLVTPQYMKNAVFLNTGADRFREIAKMSGLGSTDWTWSARFEDLDNDGWVDLHVTNGMVRPFIDSDLLSQTRKMETQREVIALMKAQPPQRDVNLAFRNDGNLRFNKVQADWGLDHASVSFGSAFADFDRDGDLDLVYVNYDDGVSLYRNDCPAGNSLVIELRGRGANTRAVGATVLATTSQGRQTRRLTVARGALSSSEPVLHFGLGGDTAATALEIRWPDGQVQPLGALPANAHYVVTEPAASARPGPAVAHRPADRGLLGDQAAALGLDYVNQERVFNDMRRPAQSLLPNRMNTLGGGLAWGDANGDGHPDLFFAGPAGQSCGLYLSDGAGRFVRSRQQQPWDDTIEREAMAAVFLDVERDGDLDLLITAGSTEPDKGSDLLRSRLYLNKGHARFTAAAPERFPAPPVSSGPVVAGDFDRDGDLDVFIGGRVVPGEYPRTPESQLLENRDGTFVDVTDTVCPELRKGGMVTAALWTDADGDGRPDLLVTGEWMPLRLFRNAGDGRLTEITAAAGLAGLTGWWNSLTAADVNHDGRLDYIAGNHGLNSKYHASPEHPTSIYYGDFEGNGRCEIVESEFEGDKLYPVRGRSCSSRAMPSLRTKFPTFRTFGAALLPEIYPQEKLNAALQLHATQLASGVFLNTGDGRFAFKPFPRLAQTAPIFGTAAADFNGDGRMDIVAVQNFHGPQVETGRYDGGIGLLLLGGGTGDFTVAPAQVSGVHLPGEGRGVALGDWDGDGRPGLVVTRINEPVLALAPRAAPDGRAFSVKLAGTPGNPDAIGARITVRYTDGSQTAAELAAGSGYLSQSEPRAFFTCAAGQTPAGIDVIWPDGTRTTHAVPGGTARIVLTRPD
ncbi:MAG: FG-GAP-like repeat-containing protein [Verrucomicrobiota bacterium]